MNRHSRQRVGFLVALCMHLAGCAGDAPSSAPVAGAGPGTSRQVSECNFTIEFAPGSSALDASAQHAIQAIAARTDTSRSAAVHSWIAPGEREMLIAARYDEIRAALLGAGVPQPAIRQIIVYDLLPSAPPRANVNVCGAWDIPLRQRRAEPAYPQRLIEYQIGATTMRIPLALLGPNVWNDVPLELPVNPPTLYLSRDGGSEADISAIRQAADGPNNDEGRRRLIIATLRPWPWTPALDPPSYRLPPNGSTQPSPRSRPSFTVSRSRHPPGPANYFARFAWRDGTRTVIEGGCTRYNVVARTDASAFISDRQAVCNFDMLRVTPTAGARLLFWIDNLDEVPEMVERARVALLRYVVPAPAP